MAQRIGAAASAKAKKLWSSLGRFRYPALIVLLGVVLMLLPGREKTEQPAETGEPDAQAWLEENERRIENILCKLDGAGSVSVALSLKTGMQYAYQTDITTEQDRRTEQTVFLKNGSDQTPVVLHSRCPEYLGAVVAAEGADRAEVRLQITQAVSDLTGLGSDKISVIKMKKQ